MEENEQDTNTQPGVQNNPPTAPILDVQPSQPTAQAEPVREQPNSKESVPTDTDASPAPSLPSQPEAENPSAMPSPEVGGINAPNPIKQPELPAPKKHKGPMVAIILAIVVALTLAVVAVMAFTKGDKPNSGTTPPASDKDTSEVTPQTIDATTKEIDDTVSSVNEAEDFPDDELSDQTLGL